MSQRALQLENFDRDMAILSAQPDGGLAPDPDRMAVFDEGYAAGWEDSETATRTEQDHADSAMRARLQDLSFTFHEARAHVMRMLHPMLNAVMEQALPEILHKTLGQRLVAEIDEMAQSTSDGDIELLVAPGHQDAAENLLSGITALPFVVAEDDTLAAGEMHMRLGTAEREINMNTLLSSLRDALSALDTINKDTVAHG